MREQLQKIESTEVVKMTDTGSLSARKSWFYVLGVYLGDGCVTGEVFRLNTIDMDFALMVESALKEMTDSTITIHTNPVKNSSKPNHSLYCGDTSLAQKLVEDTKSKKEIPFYVNEATDENKKSFISGLMDSEGYVARAKSGRGMHFCMGYKSCDVWVQDFIKILQSVGIKIGKVSYEKPYKTWYKTPIQFGIKIASWVDSGCHFNISRKEERVIDWKNNYRFYVRRPDYLQRLHVRNGNLAIVI